jgi:hypothetical protein
VVLRPPAIDDPLVVDEPLLPHETQPLLHPSHAALLFCTISGW